MGFLCKRVENGERREESSDACQITTRLGPSAQVGSRTLSPTERGRVVVKLNGTCLKYSACSQTPKTKTAFEAVSEADLHLTFFIMTGRFVLASFQFMRIILISRSFLGLYYLIQAKIRPLRSA